MITSTHLHAMLIHFPVALLLVGFLSEVISLITKKEFFKNAAFYLLLLGALGAVAAYLTGNAAGAGIEAGTLKKALDLHEQAATISLWLTIITALSYLIVALVKYKKAWTRIATVVLFTAVVFSIVRTGYLGGQLVYKHGAGVELALPDFSNPGAEEK